MADACDLSAVEARRQIGLRQLSPVELLESCLRRIEATNGAVNAIVAMDADAARKRAKAVEQAIGRGDELGLLAGLPIGIKDLQATAGLRTTLGSLLYEDHVPAEDEFGVANIRRAGGIVLGKTNTPEFGAGGNTRNRVYGATGNPFDPTKTSGGSSGGSAAALALGQVALATGSDLGGSLRTPAAFCGVVGFRPSPGVVPSVDRANGLFVFSVIGPMGRSVEDAHLLLRAQIGEDKRDLFSSGDGARIPSRLTGADLGQPARGRVERPRLCASRQGHRRSLPLARQALRRSVPRGRGAGARLRACRAGFRDSPLRAVRGRPPRAPGEGARSARPQRHRQHRARHAAVAARRELGACRADQALQALPGVFQGCRRA